MDIKIETTVEAKLGTLEWKRQPDANILLRNAGASAPCATKCAAKTCTTVCPAKVYEWEGAHGKIIVNYENCIECGACRMLCPFDNINCEWPGGGMGVKYKYG